jgi:hypothetical protein
MKGIASMTASHQAGALRSVIFKHRQFKHRQQQRQQCVAPATL